MLKRLHVQGFKSLRDVTIELPRLAVIFGPNASGKSNLLDAIQALSWIGNARTVFDALGYPFPVRGHMFEAFSFPSEGIAGLIGNGSVRFTLEADLNTEDADYRYRVTPELLFPSGELRVVDEYLAQLGARGAPKGKPAIERVDGYFHIRRKRKPAHPRQESVGINHSVLSDRSLSGPEYQWLDQVRGELQNWRAYYLEPRTAMRADQPPSDTFDIGFQGEFLAPFLYKLRATMPKHYRSVALALRSIVSSVEELSIELDKQRGLLDLAVRQSGVAYSSRVLSEGTLRVLALCAIVVNPWGGSLVALEEPENGVDPRRIDLIAQLLMSLAAVQGRQVVVTTHSPLFCDAIIKAGEEHPGYLQLFNVRRDGQATQVEALDMSGPLFQDQEIADALDGGGGVVQKLLASGFVGG